jgi:hypothetical protein
MTLTSNVAVTPKTASLKVGETLQLAGKVTPVWASSNPAVATVTQEGIVTAVAPGSAKITEHVGSASGACTLVVVAAPVPSPILAASDFSDGVVPSPSTLPFFYMYPPEDIAVIDDPTGSGLKKVLQFHYNRSDGSGSADRNRSITYVHPVGWGETMSFRGDCYFPIDSFDVPTTGMGRKLLYWEQHPLEWQYGANRTYFCVISLMGKGLHYEFGNEEQIIAFGDDIAFPSVRTWHRIKVKLQNQSSPGVADGAVSIWLDGIQVLAKTGLSWVPSSWIGVPVPGGNGVPLDAADMSFEHFQIGDQVNSLSNYDEYRYWGNIAFSREDLD